MNNVGNSGPQPIPAEAGANKPIPVETKPASGPAPVSRAPLNLGGTGAPAATPAPVAAPRAAAPVARPAPLRPVAAAGANERITGCKTFFTKLHPGAIDFMDEQITQWLKDNPGIIVRATSAVTGEIQSKKTEPNILLTVWYSGQVTTKAAAHMG